MRSKAETLDLIVTIALRPLENAEYPTTTPTALREHDPLWQVGHAAFDACRALVSPFDRNRALETRFAVCFHGRRSLEPWSGERQAALYRRVT